MIKRLETYWSDKWVLSLTSGILLGLSFPPFPFPFLLFPAWVLLFRLAELADSWRNAALWGYVSFVIWNLLTTYWMTMATVAGGIAAILSNAAIMTIPFAFQHRFQKEFKSSWLIVVFQSAVWVSYEYLHHQWDLAWPWLALGNAWSNVPSLIQYISFTGHLGISFWVLIVAALSYQAIRKTGRNYATAVAVITLLFPSVSLLQYASNGYDSDVSIEVAVVQPNFDTYHDYGGYDNPQEALELLIALSDSVRTPATDFILWPESGIRTPLFSIQRFGTTGHNIKQRLLEQSADWEATVVTGATYYEYFTEGNIPPLARISGPNTYPNLYYNAALGFYPDGTYGVYRKHNLVPLVERIPFVHLLHRIDLFGLVDWRSNQGYGKGQFPDSFNTDGTSTPALICYDSVFPGWSREFVREGAGFLSIITNDGWWGYTSGHLQHFAYARLRAIEFRRWVVRSANNGISGIIDPYGGVQVETDYWEQTAFNYRVPILDRQTVFARWGDWLSYLMIALSGIGIGWLLLITRITSPRNFFLSKARLKWRRKRNEYVE